MTSIQARSIFLCAVSLVGLVPRLAGAETPSAPPSPPPGAPISPAAVDSPEHGHAGLVFGVSVGYSAPAGNTTSAPGDSLSSTLSFQIPLSLDLGFNVLPSLFVGVYGTFADGGSGSALFLTCSQNSCSQMSFRGGLVIEYRFLPGRTFEPWIGYGAGYDTTMLAQTSVNEFGVTQQRSATTLSGWDFGHARVGLDFLIDRFSAAGFYSDVGFGRFGQESMQVASEPSVGRSITNQALHEWITFGVRWTFMP
jgi:hypothetical protein